MNVLWMKVAMTGVTLITFSQIDASRRSLELWQNRQRYLVGSDGKTIPVEKRDKVLVFHIGELAYGQLSDRAVLWLPQETDGNAGLKRQLAIPGYNTVAEIMFDSFHASESSEERRKWSSRVVSVCQAFLVDPRLREAMNDIWNQNALPNDLASDSSVLTAHNFSPAACKFRELDKGLLNWQRLLSQKPKQVMDYPHLVSYMGGLLSAARRQLGFRAELPPSDWGVLAGLEWFHGQDQVRIENGVVYLNTKCLTKLGIPVSIKSGSIGITNGLKNVSLRVSNVASPTRAMAVRNAASGEVFLPVEELKRQGLYDVVIDKTAQVVMILASVPGPEKPATPAETKRVGAP